MRLLPGRAQNSPLWAEGQVPREYQATPSAPTLANVSEGAMMSNRCGDLTSPGLVQPVSGIGSGFADLLRHCIVGTASFLQECVALAGLGN